MQPAYAATGKVTFDGEALPEPPPVLSKDKAGLLKQTRIYATDLNEDTLAVARLGSYPLERVRRYEDAYERSGGHGRTAETRYVEVVENLVI